MTPTLDTTIDDGSRLRQRVARVHAILLFAITISATTGAALGWQDIGPLTVLADQPWGFVGLYQAYYLMFLLALVALIGSARWPRRLWNATLLTAHFGPITAAIITYDVIAETGGTAIAATVVLGVHAPLVLLETFALLWKAPFLRTAQTP
jgi:hypothetical protein